MYRIVEVGSFSLPEPTKEHNEDALLFPIHDQNSNIIFAIADGVGSTTRANKASECVINSISITANKHDFSITKALNQAKDDLDNFFKKNEQYKNSATTLTLIQISEEKISIGHVGDCRAYFKSENKLIQLTKDHTRYQELLDSREHSLKNLRQHKKRLSSVITKAISTQSPLAFDTYEYYIKELIHEGSLIVSLMSDGAYEHWQRRPRFSESTMSSPSAFTNSLRKRIEAKPNDDFSCLSVKLKIE